MSKNTFNPDDLEQIRKMCELSRKIGLNLAKGIRVSPAETKEEILREEKIVTAINSVKR